MTEQHPDVIDNPIERLELLAGDEEAIASFLDQIDVTGPRDREMLGELARTQTLADPERFPGAHRRAVGSLETLARHGYHGSSAATLAGPLKNVIRWLIQLVARYVVVSHLRQAATDLRNLYWLREIETEPLSPDRIELGRARQDAEALVAIFKRREIGLPSFVIGGLLIPVFATGWRLAQGVASGTGGLRRSPASSPCSSSEARGSFCAAPQWRVAAFASRRELHSTICGGQSATAAGRREIRAASSR